jgi:HEAT repeat protein
MCFWVPQTLVWGQPQQEAVDIVIDALKSNDPAMQTGAIALVRDIPGSEVTKALAKELPNLPAAAQVQLLSALADRGDPASLPAVKDAAGAADESVRIAALKAVGQLGDASCVTMLARKAAQSRGQEQKAAQESLYRLRGEAVDRAILAELSSAEPDVKMELIQAVGQRNIVSGVPALLETAKDEDTKVQRESFKVLKTVAGPERLPALVKLLIHLESTSVRNEAEKTIAAIAHKIEDKDRQAEAVLDALPAVEDVQAKRSLYSVLGKIGDDSALAVLRPALRSSNAEIQVAAIRALSDWPNAKPAEDLLKVAETSDNKVHRILALRGFVRLLGLPSERSTAETMQMYEQAMDLAPNTSEKRRVLSGLANVKSPAALEIAASYLDDGSLHQEAEIALIKIAESIYGSYPDKTKDILQRLIQSSKSDSIRQRAQKVINQIERFEDYITAWQVSAPYTKQGADGTELFDVAFAPEKADADIKWQIMPAGTSDDRPWLMELDKVFGGDNRVGYLRTNVWSDTQQKAQLEIGSDDGIKVWLNGEVVHANNVTRPASPGQDKVEVVLKQGWNDLLLKLTQGGGEWAVCARLRDVDGSKLEGLKVQAEKK